MHPPCPACGKQRGSNGRCLSCREAAARELAREAEDVTDGAAAKRGRSLSEARPWYARSGSGKFLPRLRLLGMVLSDQAHGRYHSPPARRLTLCAAAAAYAALPVDLLPDALVPGGADDFLVVALAKGLVKRELRAYCAWKGISPAHFGL
ncbi:MAG TPA: DUF1232 domain-containing protein [Anaeromyxobacteraceae bacterium]|nr:DUF1232 domain-containing protein [Anaeromyxobacteraceae bacterium]